MKIIGFLISRFQFNAYAPKSGICIFILTLDDCRPGFDPPPTPKLHNLGWIIAQVINNSNLNFKNASNPVQNNTNGAVYSKMYFFLCKEKRKKTQFTHIIKAAPCQLFVFMILLFWFLFFSVFTSRSCTLRTMGCSSKALIPHFQCLFPYPGRTELRAAVSPPNPRSTLEAARSASGMTCQHYLCATKGTLIVKLMSGGKTRVSCRDNRAFPQSRSAETVTIDLYNMFWDFCRINLAASWFSVLLF